jgi:hypothetical protein
LVPFSPLTIAFFFAPLSGLRVDYQVSHIEKEVRVVNPKEIADDDKNVPIHDADEQDETIVASNDVVTAEMVVILEIDSNVQDIPPQLLVVVAAAVDVNHVNNSLVDVQHAKSMVYAEEAMNDTDMRLLDGVTIPSHGDAPPIATAFPTFLATQSLDLDCRISS